MICLFLVAWDRSLVSMYIRIGDRKKYNGHYVKIGTAISRIYLLWGRLDHRAKLTINMIKQPPIYSCIFIFNNMSVKEWDLEVIKFLLSIVNLWSKIIHSDNHLVWLSPGQELSLLWVA